MAENRNLPSRVIRIAFEFVCVAVLILALCGCSGGGGSASSSSSEGSYVVPEIVRISFDKSESDSGRDCYIDTKHVKDGYVVVSATSSARLKFQILNGSNGYNYDLANDGTASCFTLNMGNGTYSFRVMQNTEGSSYIELFSTTVDVSLSSEFAPFLCPGPYCDFSEDSSCVAKARELVKSANSDYEAADAIYTWVISNVSYDRDKAAKLTNTTGYLPDADETLSSCKGICLDYASLVASMMRSVGIPTKVITGYVSDNNLYHAWNMVYLNGEWVSISFSADENTWSRIDSTFASAGESSQTGDGESYVDKYSY